MRLKSIVSYRYDIKDAAVTKEIGAPKCSRIILHNHQILTILHPMMVPSCLMVSNMVTVIVTKMDSTVESTGTD